jgi:peroxiredoxin family protein
MAIDLDVKFLACLMSMDVMEIEQADLIDEVEDVVGAATFIAEAQNSEINLFI